MWPSRGKLDKAMDVAEMHVALAILVISIVPACVLGPSRAPGVRVSRPGVCGVAPVERQTEWGHIHRVVDRLKQRVTILKGKVQNIHEVPLDDVLIEVLELDSKDRS